MSEKRVKNNQYKKPNGNSIKDSVGSFNSINESFRPTSEQAKEIMDKFKSIVDTRLDKLYDTRGADGEMYAYGIAVNQVKKKAEQPEEAPAEETPAEEAPTEDNMNKDQKLKEMIQAALSKPLNEKKLKEADDLTIKNSYIDEDGDLDFKQIQNDLIKTKPYYKSLLPNYLNNTPLTDNQINQLIELFTDNESDIFDADWMTDTDKIKFNQRWRKADIDDLSDWFVRYVEGLSDNWGELELNEKKKSYSFTSQYDDKFNDKRKNLPDGLQKSILKKQSGLDEDLDLGHQDDEPHMVKADLYRIGKYAMELYKMVDQFEGEQEVDFPHWWQSKIIKAKDMLVSAKHYLDFKLKEPQLDAMVDVASEEGAIDEMSKKQIKKRGKIYDALKAKGMSDEKAGKIATSQAMKAKIKEAIIAKLKSKK